MDEGKPLTELEVIEFVHRWYYNLNTHAPIEEFLPMLSKEGPVMKFPEAILEGIDSFKDWHKTVTHKFFDQDHNIKYLDIRLNGKEANIRVIVRWQARIWEAPAAKSSWLGYDAYQSWVVERDNSTGGVAIKEYSVDAFIPMEGSN